MIWIIGASVTFGLSTSFLGTGQVPVSGSISAGEHSKALASFGAATAAPSAALFTTARRFMSMDCHTHTAELKQLRTRAPRGQHSESAGKEGGSRRRGGRTIIMGEKAAVDPSMAASAATLHAVFIVALLLTMRCALSGPHISFGFFTTDPNLIQVYFFRIDSKIGTINSCFGRILVDRTAQFKYCVAEDCGILRYSQKETYFCTKPNREIQKHFERKKKKKVQTDQFAAR